MSPTVRRGLFVFLVGLLMIAAAITFDFWWRGGGGQIGAGSGGLAGVSIGGPFTLVDQNGVTRRDSDFRGELMLVYFGYTYCPDACPTALQTMSSALDALGARAKEVRPVFITVDPERDTIGQMKLYASNFHERLLALTGTVDETAAAARGYRVYFEKAKQSSADDYLVDHSSYIFLMGRDGRYLTHFGPAVTADQMAAAIKPYL